MRTATFHPAPELIDCGLSELDGATVEIIETSHNGFEVRYVPEDFEFTAYDNELFDFREDENA